jgi:alcohol dehydrogenase/L-iditol 2-dehydrogenase
MPALVNYSAEPGSVELRDVPVPEIGSGQVLLRVQAVSVCGSDLHQWQGKHSWKVNYPCILGHEFCGTVAATGSEVFGFREGDRVVSETAAIIDEHSPFARRGDYNLDPSRRGFGYGTNGAMAPYVAVPERCLHHLPDDLQFRTAALTEPACVAFNAVCVNTRIFPGDLVVIIGPGPIGLLCLLFTKLSGSHPVMVAGLPADRQRLDLAKRLGADEIIDGRAEDFIRTYGDGFGADVVIDAAGASATLETALSIVRPGGKITKVGWGPQPLGFSLDPLVQKGVTLQGSFSHTWWMWERVIRLLAARVITVDPLVSRVAPLSEWHACFDGMHHGEYVKTVLLPEE